MMIRTIFSALFMVATAAVAQPVVQLKQQKLSRWGIGTANYSGIAPLQGDHYAVVSDKEPQDGFFEFRIVQNPVSGQVEYVALEGFRGNPSPRVDRNGKSIRDCEGIAYNPSLNTIFISGEGDQQILEYKMDGQPTGRGLNIPSEFRLENIRHNYGFESLTYNATTGRFWTTTETTLKSDGDYVHPLHLAATNLLRLQSFGNDLQPVAQYAYRMEPHGLPATGRYYCYGVSDMCALSDGRLIVMERELDVPENYLGAKSVSHLFLVNPVRERTIDSTTPLSQLSDDVFVAKQLLCSVETQISPFAINYANYEGMCLGRKLDDGRQTLLLVNDSQASVGKGPFHLRDFIKVIILPYMKAYDK